MAPNQWGSTSLSPAVLTTVLKQKMWTVKLPLFFLDGYRVILSFCFRSLMALNSQGGYKSMQTMAWCKKKSLDRFSGVLKPQMDGGENSQLDKAFPMSTDSTGPCRHPRSDLRVCCSLCGFCFLAFAFLILLLEAVHVSSEEVGVRLGREG